MAASPPSVAAAVASSQEQEQKQALFAVFVEPSSDETLPSDDTMLKLKALIDELAEANQTSTWLPHITLWKGQLPADMNIDLLREEVGAALLIWTDNAANPELRFRVQKLNVDNGRIELAFQETPAVDLAHQILQLCIKHSACSPEEVDNFKPHLTLIAHTGIEDGKTPPAAPELIGAESLAQALFEDSRFATLLRGEGLVGHKIWLARARGQSEARSWDVMARFKLASSSKRSN